MVAVAVVDTAAVVVMLAVIVVAIELVWRPNLTGAEDKINFKDVADIQPLFQLLHNMAFFPSFSSERSYAIF